MAFSYVQKIIHAASMAGNVTGSWFVLGDRGLAAVQVFTESSGVPDHAGTLYIDMTADPTEAAYFTLGAPVFSITAGAVISTGAELPDVGFYYVRARYVRTGGGANDTLTVVFNAK